MNNVLKEQENEGSNGVENAARRKLEQELGIPLDITEKWSFNHIGRMEYSCRWNEDWIEREIDHIMVVNTDTEVSHNENEISDVLWADSSEINRMMVTGHGFCTYGIQLTRVGSMLERMTLVPLVSILNRTWHGLRAMQI